MERGAVHRLPVSIEMDTTVSTKSRPGMRVEAYPDDTICVPRPKSAIGSLKASAIDNSGFHQRILMKMGFILLRHQKFFQRVRDYLMKSRMMMAKWHS